jgi:hypothetical protein
VHPEERGLALAATTAQGGGAEASAAPAELVHEGDDQAGP